MVTVSKPFKGTWYYEWQVGPVVFQWLHETSFKSINPKGITWGRLHIWFDSAWKLY